MKNITSTILNYTAATVITLSFISCGDNRNNTEGNSPAGESTTTSPGTGGTQQDQGTTTGSPQNEADTLNTTTRGNSSIEDNDTGTTTPRQ